MRGFLFCCAVLFALDSHAARKPRPQVDKPFAPELVANAATEELIGRAASAEGIVRAQILLDRANFSSGEIDGTYGSNLKKAISAFQAARGLRVTGEIGPEEWKLLNQDTAPPLEVYTLTPEDASGPFAKIPTDMMEKSKLPALSYESALEALAERFHASPDLLRRMNPSAAFGAAGDQILVPNVATAPPAAADRVVVDKSESSVTAVGADGKVIAWYPASIGSRRDPLPLGKWKINGVRRDPEFHYNPKLFWDAPRAHSKATIAPGPNNPVGVIWIDLSKKHAGIHGSPEPKRIGKTQSHSCIRLTNWDALELGALVKHGTPAILQE
jgi:lipoprotein-anchoring transpeptidase ErfK/SrfK